MEKKFVELAEKLRVLQGKIKFLKEQVNKCTEVLKEICDNETTSFKGYTYTKTIRLGAIKYEDVEILKDIDLDPYRGAPVTSWRLSYQDQFDSEERLWAV